MHKLIKPQTWTEIDLPSGSGGYGLGMIELKQCSLYPYRADYRSLVKTQWLVTLPDFQTRLVPSFKEDVSWKSRKPPRCNDYSLKKVLAPQWARLLRNNQYDIVIDPIYGSALRFNPAQAETIARHICGMKYEHYLLTLGRRNEITSWLEDNTPEAWPHIFHEHGLSKSKSGHVLFKNKTDLMKFQLRFG